MDEFREEILMFQNKINDKLKKEEYKISKINNTLHFRFSKIPKNIYKNLDNYKNNIVKYQDFLNSDCEKKLDIDFDIDNSSVINFFSLFFNIHDTFFFYIVNSNKIHEVSQDKFIEIENYGDKLYHFLTKKLLEKYNFKFFENSNKIRIFNLLKNKLKLNEYYKDDEEYILNKYKKFETYLASDNFILELNEIESQDVKLKNDIVSLSNLKKIMIDTKNLLNSILVELKKEEDNVKKDRTKQKNNNIVKNFNHYHTNSNSYIDIKNITNNLNDIRNEKNGLLENKKLLIKKINYYQNDTILKAMEKEQRNLNKQIEILGNKGNIEQKEQEIKDKIARLKNENEVELFLLDNKIEKNNNNIKILEIREEELIQKYEQIIAHLEKKIDNKQENTLLEILKKQKKNQSILMEYESSYRILKHKVDKNKNKLEKKKFLFLKKNKDKVLLFEEKNEILLNLNRYLHILKDNRSRTQLYYDKIKNINYLTLDDEIKEVYSLFYEKNDDKLIEELNNIIFWMVNINVQNILKKNIYFLSDNDIFKNNVYHANKIKGDILSIRNINKSIKIRNKKQLSSLIEELNYSLKKIEELKIIKNSVNILLKDLCILFKFGYN